ncbi:MAG: guanylate kinase [Candidatus Margulisbacteria bacterium]|nr:guanylate kinase [Candidatus Margulisiibacteriota bacterium]MBU1021767.1 guanylate kinase [Candidatus Margulisiibacteriota bacterium]MBU1729513.1 guanylate kinase [Candidatus Margulisiibacteriota bacterium]MBU1955386.1 guanylate kinase [Candidatus Margulisiibacteriota bacterium]
MAKKPKTGKGLLVVISGPSGVGKSTIVARLLKIAPRARLSVSTTTRKPRPGEKHGKDYFFVSGERFTEMVNGDELLEWAEVHGSYYGTPKSYIEEQLGKNRVVVLEVDVQGAQSIREVLRKKKLKAHCVFVFLIPPSVDILAFRLKKRRTEEEEMMNYRLRAAIAELQVMEKYDYIVVNDKVDSAAEKIRAIIHVEKERTFLN